MEFVGKIPTGEDIWRILIKLLAEQENLIIEYEIVKGKNKEGGKKKK